MAASVRRNIYLARRLALLGVAAENDRSCGKLGAGDNGAGPVHCLDRSRLAPAVRHRPAGTAGILYRDVSVSVCVCRTQAAARRQVNCRIASALCLPAEVLGQQADRADHEPAGYGQDHEGTANGFE